MLLPLVFRNFKLLSFLYGILLLISGFYKVQWSIDLLRQKEKRWWLAAVSAGLSILFSLIIIGNPFSTVTVTWIFSGVVLIAEAIIDIVILLERIIQWNSDLCIVSKNVTY